MGVKQLVCVEQLAVREQVPRQHEECRKAFRCSIVGEQIPGLSRNVGFIPVQGPECPGEERPDGVPRVIQIEQVPGECG